MSFDGLDHQAGWIYPIRHHSRALLPGESVGEPLRNAYVAARRRARWLASYAAGADYRAGGQWINPERGPTGAYNAVLGCSWKSLHIPAGATHLVCRAGLGGFATASVDVSARLTVGGVNGSGGTIPARAPLAGPGPSANALEDQAVLVACEFDCTSVAGTTTSVELHAFAEDGSSVAHTLFTAWAVLHWEVRG